MLKNIFVMLFLLLSAHGAMAQVSSEDLGAGMPEINFNDEVLAVDQTSIGYNTLMWVSGELRVVIFKIYEGFTTIVSPLLYMLTALTILGVIVGYIINKPPHFYTIISIVTLIIVLRTLIMNSGVFEFWIYEPINSIMKAGRVNIIEFIGS